MHYKAINNHKDIQTLFANFKNNSDICGWIAGLSVTFWNQEALCLFMLIEM